MSSAEWLLKDPVDGGHYLVEQPGCSTVNLSGGVLILKFDGWLEFALLQSGWTYDDRSNGTIIFTGYGCPVVLRECRHTYWGDDEDGYLFYPNGILITEAFQVLARYFDNMAPKELAWPDEPQLMALDAAIEEARS